MRCFLRSLLHSLGLAAIAFGAVAAVAPALALPKPPKIPVSKPFAAVNVRLPAPPSDPSFAAFRQSLAALARRRSFDELAHLMIANGFFWDRDSGKRFDPKRLPAQNLATALRLDQGSDSGWEMLADFAAEPTASPSSAAPGILCAPGRPGFDQNDFDALLDATRTTANDWVYPRVAGVVLHRRQSEESPPIETLGSYFVRLLRFQTAPANAVPLHTSWARIIVPDGKVGSVAPDTISSLSAAQLCYAKDITGRWVIAGFIGGGS